MTEVQKAERRVVALRDEARELRDQAARHRRRGNADGMIQRELARTRGDLYHAHRALRAARSRAQ